MTQIVILAHNIRSTHNVGAILRTADGFGVQKVIFSGYTPYPEQANDPRLPHLRRKISQQIHKTALGAEKSVPNHYYSDPLAIIQHYRQEAYRIVALEQAANSHQLPHYRAENKLLLLLGEEVEGVAPELLAKVDDLIEIPMTGQKESFNVSVATGIALYHLTLVSPHQD